MNSSTASSCDSTPSTSPPLFPGTNIPLACLFIHLEHGYTIKQFLQDFPSVQQEQVQQVLEWTIELFKNGEEAPVSDWLRNRMKMGN